MTDLAKRFKKVTLVCCLCLVLIPSCKKKKAEEGARLKTAEEASYVFASVFIYDSRSLSLTPDIPLLVKAVFTNPLEDKPVTLKGLASLKLVVGDESGHSFEISWEMLPAQGGALEAEASLGIYWMATPRLAPGSYRINLEWEGGIARAKSSGEIGLRVEPALLTIKEGTAGPEEKAFYERRLMLVQKKFDALLNLLQAGLEKNPADQSLRLEYIDALAMAGEREKAAGEMLQLIVSIQESQAKAAPDKPPHIPSWMFEYLDNLKKK